KPGGTGMPRAVISASPAPLPPRRSLPRPAPSATPFPKKKIRFTEPASLMVGSDGFRPLGFALRTRIASFLHDDLGKIRQTRKFFLNRGQQGKAVAPQVLFRAIDQNLHKESIERRSDRSDHLQRFAVAPR